MSSWLRYIELKCHARLDSLDPLAWLLAFLDDLAVKRKKRPVAMLNMICEFDVQLSDRRDKLFISVRYLPGATISAG